MYAVIEVGGKQHRVKPGDSINVERQEEKEGKSVNFKQVLLVCGENESLIGQPYVKNAVVEATIEKHFRGEKVMTYKYRRRKSSHFSKGHRQNLTRIKIVNVSVGN
ncbi:50S ribosomal protein L21 [bacterium]|nr:MAG: 50S ribosomal protein L21 [bacterium]